MYLVEFSANELNIFNFISKQQTYIIENIWYLKIPIIFTKYCCHLFLNVVELDKRCRCERSNQQDSYFTSHLSLLDLVNSFIIIYLQISIQDWGQNIAIQHSIVWTIARCRYYCHRIQCICSNNHYIIYNLNRPLSLWLYNAGILRLRKAINDLIIKINASSVLSF